MKYLLPLFLLSTAFADEICDASEDPPFTYETPAPTPEPVSTEPSHSLWDYHPIHVGGNFITLSPANVKIKDGPEDGTLRFNKANAFLYMLLPISEKSYFFPRVEWNTFALDWDKNPKFRESRFYYMQFALTFYTTAIEQWRWIMRANYNLDLKHMQSPKKYGLFEALLWGAYQPHRKWHVHVGAFGYTGMEGQQVYPIIGADYSPDKEWTFLAIFPIDYAVQYKLNKEWRFSAKIRPLKERFRAGRQQPQPRSVFSYSSTGAELNVHYEKFMRFELEAFGGYNFGGKFYIKDSHGHNALYTTVDGSIYGGVNADYAF